MIKNSMLSLVLFFVCLSCSSFAQDKWIWEKEVVFQENHDPSEIFLKDKSVLVFWNLDDFGIVDEWEEGKKLLLAYNTEKGLNLVDKETSETVLIKSGLETHPIDLICNDCINENGSTMGMRTCYFDALKLWDGELNRVYRDVIGSLSATEQNKLRAAQLKWIDFRDAQIEFITEIYSSEDCGSNCLLEEAVAICELTKTQAERLNWYYYP